MRDKLFIVFKRYSLLGFALFARGMFSYWRFYAM